LGYKTEQLRCDNSGENNKYLTEICNQRGISLEMTAPYTPQMNGVVERAFVTTRDRAYASMLAARFNTKSQNRLWAEAIHTATKIGNILPTQTRPIAPHNLFFKSDSKLHNFLQPFGRIAYITIRQEFHRKFSPKSKKGVFVGYADNHPPDTFRFYDPKTDKIFLSRDIAKWTVWHGIITGTDDLSLFDEIKHQHESTTIPEEILNPKMEKKSTTDPTSLLPENKSVEEVPLINIPPITPPNIIDDQNSPKRHQGEAIDKTPLLTKHKLLREIRGLDTSYNPITLNEILYTTILPNEFVYHVNSASTPSEAPKNYKEMMKLNDEEWKQAHNSEIQNFLKRNAWDIIHQEKMNITRRPLRTRFVYRIKSDGTKKARCVIKGYEQVPGIDFNEFYSPLATDTTIRIVLAMALYYSSKEKQWTTELIDVEAAFLNDEVDQDIFIEIPEGLHEFMMKADKREISNHVIKLKRAQYGLVQSPRLWMLTFSNILKSIGMRQCKSDPCLFIFPVSGDPKAIIIVYCDDCIITGINNTVKSLKEEISKHVKITQPGILTQHLGVNWKFGDDKYGPYLEGSMHEYTKSICNDYEKFMGATIKPQNTPGAHNVKLQKNHDELNIINIDEFRSFVGRILFMARKVDPYLTNSVRELSTHLSSPTEAHWKSLSHLVEYLKNNPMSLKLRAPKSLKIISFVDSDYASDKNDRKSVTGYLTTIGGCLVTWHSKKQNSITLSSTEAEYVAMSTATAEIKFVSSTLEEILGEPPPMPSIIYEDNTGAIFMAKNLAITQRTKHVDIRTRFINEMVLEGKLDIKHIRSVNNPADGMTKNLPSHLNMKHSKAIQNGTLLDQTYDQLDREDVNTNRAVCRPDHKTVLYCCNSKT